VIQLL